MCLEFLVLFGMQLVTRAFYVGADESASVSYLVHVALSRHNKVCRVVYSSREIDAELTTASDDEIPSPQIF